MKKDSKTKSCSMTKTCTSKKSLLIAFVGVFIFTYIFDFIVHGMLLSPIYMATANLWRPMPEMQGMIWQCLAYHLANAAVFVSIFACYMGYVKTCCDAQPEVKRPCVHSIAIGFGVKLGLLLGVNAAATYIWMPIPLELALAWFAAAVIKGAGIGAVISFSTCKKGGCK